MTKLKVQVKNPTDRALKPYVQDQNRDPEIVDPELSSGPGSG